MKALRFITLLLMVIGSINWGLVGFFNFDIIESLFGTGGFARFLYIIIGLAGLYGISFFCISEIYTKTCTCMDRFCKK